MFRFAAAKSRRRGPIAKVSRKERQANRELREALAAKFEREYLEIIERGRFDVTEELLGRILTGTVLGVPEEGLASIQADIATALSNQFREAIDGGARLGLRFSGAPSIDIDPSLITDIAERFIRGQGGQRIVGINAETRKAVNQIVADSLTQGFSPTQAARDIGQKVGLTRQQAKALARFEERITAQRIVSEQADTALAREAIAEDVENYRNRLLRQRGRNIAENETQVAIQHGERGFWEQAAASNQVDTSLLYKTWFTVLDDRVCPICEPLHGVTIRFNDSFSSRGFVGLSPPGHVSCRCFLEYGDDPDPSGSDESRSGTIPGTRPPGRGGAAVPLFLIGAALAGAAAALGRGLVPDLQDDSGATILPFPSLPGSGQPGPFRVPIAARRKKRSRPHWRTTSPKKGR